MGTFSREQRRAATPRAESPSPGQYNVDSCWKSIEKPKTPPLSFNRGPAHTIFQGGEGGPPPLEYDIEKCKGSLEKRGASSTIGTSARMNTFNGQSGPAPGQYDVEGCAKRRERRPATCSFNRGQGHSTFTGCDGPAPGQYNVSAPQRPRTGSVSFSRARVNRMF